MLTFEMLISDMTEESLAQLKEIALLVQTKNNILITAHASPDGDALGSTCAMGFICKLLGKQFALYNESELSDFFSFLPFPSPLIHSLDELPFKPELIICLDCGDRARLGRQSDKLLKLAPSVNIDHHVGNQMFGSIANWADSSMAATGNAIGLLAMKLGLSLKDELAYCIYLTLLTDTGSFAHDNTNTRVMLLATHIVEQGLRPSIVQNAVNNQWTENKTRLWAYLYSTYVIEGSIAYCLISKAALEEFNCTKEDAEGFVEQLRRIKGIRISFVVREDKAFESKVSLRSQGTDDVQKVASYFSGGGHKNASGATLRLSLSEAKQEILKAIHKNIDL